MEMITSLQQNYYMKLQDRGFIFAGCSFTFGYGLNYYYHDHTEDNGTAYGHISPTSPQAHLLYQYSKRFSNKVANHYNTFHIQPERVSGSDIVNVEWLTNLLEGKDSDFINYSNFKTKDFHTLIFQTSFIDRNIEFLYNKIYKKNGKLFQSPDEAVDYLHGLETKDKGFIYNQLIKLTEEKIKQVCNKFELDDINVYFINATDCYKNIKHIKDRTIYIEHNGKKYFCIDEITDDDESTRIAFDTKFFGNEPPHDFHPSLDMHHSIYKSIVNTLEGESN